jgi:hypothetical protein
VIEPVRGDAIVFGATAHVTIPLPILEAPEATVSDEESLIAAQPKLGTFTCIAKDPLESAPRRVMQTPDSG